MSDIALVMVEATQARIGDIDIWPDDYHLFSEDVQSDDVLIVRKPTRDERSTGLIMSLDNAYKPIGKITEVMTPFWAFRLTAIGDWIETFTNPVSYCVDGAGWDEFQANVSELVKIAERIQHEDNDLLLCPMINFVVAYQLRIDRSIDWESGSEEVDSWCELLGEVDLDKIPQIVKGKK